MVVAAFNAPARIQPRWAVAYTIERLRRRMPCRRIQHVAKRLRSANAAAAAQCAGLQNFNTTEKNNTVDYKFNTRTQPSARACVIGR
jgi:hypothetical protein